MQLSFMALKCVASAAQKEEAKREKWTFLCFDAVTLSSALPACSIRHRFSQEKEQ